VSDVEAGGFSTKNVAHKGEWQYIGPATQISALILGDPQFYFSSVEQVPSDYVDMITRQPLTKKVQILNRGPGFGITVSSETVNGSIWDFTELSLRNRGQSEITVTSPSGVKTTGLLTLWPSDYISDGEFALVADIDDGSGSKLILVRPNCEIKRVGAAQP
jgi:hypothetical protein